MTDEQHYWDIREENGLLNLLDPDKHMHAYVKWDGEIHMWYYDDYTMGFDHDTGLKDYTEYGFKDKSHHDYYDMFDIDEQIARLQSLREVAAKWFAENKQKRWPPDWENYRAGKIGIEQAQELEQDQSQPKKSRGTMNIPKYRAWHKQLKLMMPVLEINLDPEHGGVFVEDKDGHYCGCRLNMDLWPWSDIELMQSTNNHDEHKTETYQGDLIEIMNCWSEKNHAYVTWEKVNPFYEWMIGETWVLHFIDGPAKGEPAPLYPYCQPRSGLMVTIIGNIYENSDLLPQEQ